MVDAVTPIPNSSLLNNPQTLQQWLQVLEGLFPSSVNTSGTTSGTSTTINSSDADNPILAMVQMLMGQLGQGVNSSSIQALLGPIFAQLRDVALPGIQGRANSAGVYNSQTQRLLQGDALARATAQGGAVVATQQNAIQAQIATLLNTLAQSTRRTNQATNQSNNQTQQKSGQAGNAAKAALGAAGAGGLAKLVDKLKEGNINNQNEKFDVTRDDEGNLLSDKQFNITGDDEGNLLASGSGGIGIGDMGGSTDDLSWLDNLFGGGDSGADFGSPLGNDSGLNIGDDSISGGNWWDDFTDPGSSWDFGGFGGGPGDNSGGPFDEF